MPGIKGMHHIKTDTKTMRKRLWSSMRIIPRFTLADLLRTSPGATYVNARKFVATLVTHGIVIKIGTFVSGSRGQQQQYRLNRNLGPLHPSTCDVCGQSLTAKDCFDPRKEKETNEQEQTKAEAGHDPA